MIIEYKGQRPQIAESAFIAPNATIIGNVVIGEEANIWFGAVLRGDEGQITIGPRCSIQDNTVIHTNHDFSTILEAEVTIGHAVVMEGCHIKKGALIGMNATILEGAVIEEGALVGAGSLVRQGQTIPAHTLAVGVPAQIKGEMSEGAKAHIAEAAPHYQELAKNYRHVGLKPEA